MQPSDRYILLVEDNPSDAMLTIRALKKHNLAANLVHLTDGAQALDFIFARGEYAGRNIEHKPKVILLDLKMPKVSGLEVLKIIKADEKSRQIPVVMMTSSEQEKDIFESHQLGVNSYVVKPVDFDDFSDAISRLGIYWVLVNNTPH
ncbi:MAG: response regulator [Ferruginibacter sp.]